VNGWVRNVTIYHRSRSTIPFVRVISNVVFRNKYQEGLGANNLPSPGAVAGKKTAWCLDQMNSVAKFMCNRKKGEGPYLLPTTMKVNFGFGARLPTLIQSLSSATKTQAKKKGYQYIKPGHKNPRGKQTIDRLNFLLRNRLVFSL